MSGKHLALFLVVAVAAGLAARAALVPNHQATTDTDFLHTAEPTAIAQGDNEPPTTPPPTTAPTLPPTTAPSKTTRPPTIPVRQDLAPAPSPAPAKVVRAATQPLSTEELVERYAPPVATIRGRLSSGSGFLVAPGVLATNQHVVGPEFIDQLKIHFPSAPSDKRGPYRATLLAADARRDLAFLRIIDCDLPHLTLANDYQFRAGQEILAIGSPGSGGPDSESKFLLENAVNRGLMSTVVQINGQTFHQAGLSVNPGNSGGPILDQFGRVLGVVTMKRRDKEGITFCVPLEDVQSGLNRALAQAPKSAEAALSRHRAAVVNDRLTRLSRVYLMGLDYYGQALDAANAHGRNPNEILMQIAPELDAQVKQLNRTVTGKLDANANAVVDDMDLSPTERNWTLQMWTLCADAKKQFDQPIREANLFRARKTELRGRYDRLLAEMKK